MRLGMLAVTFTLLACGPPTTAVPESPSSPEQPAPEQPAPQPAAAQPTASADAEPAAEPAAKPQPTADAEDLREVRPVPVDPQAFEHVDPTAKQRDEAGDKVGCGKAYLDRYKADPTAANAGQLLFNAAACLEAGGTIGLAIQSRRILVSKHPKSRFVADALLANAAALSRIAYFREAAEAYEQLAARFAKRREVARALTTAVRYRLGVGDGDKAVKDAELFARLFARKQPRETAEIYLAAAAAYRDPADRRKLIRHLRGFLKRFARRAGPALELQARVRLGIALWQSACPVREIERGLCAVRVRRKAGAIYCTAKPRVELVMKPRAAGGAGDAQKMLARALRLAQKLAPGQRSVDTAYWAAAAQFYIAEAELERYLAVRLEPPPAGATMKEQNAHLGKAVPVFMREAQKLGTSAAARYAAVMKLGDGALLWGIAARARMARSRLWFEEQLLGMPIPDALLRTGYADDVRDAYCNALEERLAPARKRAQQTLEACVQLASAAGVHDDWTRWCDDQLSAMMLTRAPIEEIYVQPDQIPTPTAMSRAEATKATRADPKAIPPRLAQASYLLDDLRAETDFRKRRRIAANLSRHLSSALAIDPKNERALALFAAYFLVRAADDDNSRLLARLLLDEARARNPKSALVANARGVALASRGRLGAAAGAFREAVGYDGTLRAARLNAGSVALTMRKPDEALGHFDAVLAAAPGQYDALVGRAVALRLKNDLPGAEAALRKAYKLAARRSEAPYALALLLVNHPPDTDAGLIQVYQTSLTWFDRALAGSVAPAQRKEIADRRKQAADILQFLRDTEKLNEQAEKNRNKKKTP
jgi:hypothetical protein